MPDNADNPDDDHQACTSNLGNVTTEDDDDIDHGSNCDDDHEADLHDLNNSGNHNDSNTHELIGCASEEQAVIRESMVDNKDRPGIRKEDHQASTSNSGDGVIDDDEEVVIEESTDQDDNPGVVGDNENDDFLIVMVDEDDFSMYDDDDDDDDAETNIFSNIQNDSDLLVSNDANDSNDEVRADEADGEFDNNRSINVRHTASDIGGGEEGRGNRALSFPRRSFRVNEDTEENCGDDDGEIDDVPMNNGNASSEEQNERAAENSTNEDGEEATNYPVPLRPWNQEGRYRVEILANSGVYIDHRELAFIKRKYTKKPRTMERQLFIKIIGEESLIKMTRTGRNQQQNDFDKIPQDVIIAVKGKYFNL